MLHTLEASYLVPRPSFVLTLLVAAASYFLLVVRPLVGAVRQGDPLWAVLIVLLPPFAGIAWLLRGSSGRTVSAEASRQWLVQKPTRPRA